MNDLNEISEEQAKLNREEFKRRLKEEGRLEPFQQDREKKERPKEFHGFQ